MEGDYLARQARELVKGEDIQRGTRAVGHFLEKNILEMVVFKFLEVPQVEE